MDIHALNSLLPQDRSPSISKNETPTSVDMPYLKSASLARFMKRLPVAVLLAVIAAVIYRFTTLDIGDPNSCGALLNFGEWLDPDDIGPANHAFGQWQPPGCIVRVYDHKDIEECFQEQRVVLIGDSTVRQVFWALAEKIDKAKAQEHVSTAFENNQPHKDLEISSGRSVIKFVWDPYLNSTALEHELAAFRVDPHTDRMNESASLILLGAPGLWYARYGQENHMKMYREAIDKIVPYMDHSPEKSNLSNTMPRLGSKQSPNMLLMAPVQVPIYKALYPPRAETITPDKIDQMNDYLQQVSANAKADIIWSFSLMTSESANTYKNDGLHVVDNVARRKADVLLNLRCNAANAVSFPHDRTCCMEYQGSHGHPLLVIGGIFVIHILFDWAGRRFSILRFLPKHETTKALFWMSVILFYCYYADRTRLFEKTLKHFSKAAFLLPLVLLVALSLPSLRAAQLDMYRPFRDILSQDQTDELKGWMQAAILVYHYTGASRYLPIYMVVRILVAGYLFLTGYGHTLSFLKNGDYSLTRVATVLVRVNMLAIALTYMMGTEYAFYYFPGLVTFWYLIVFATLRIGQVWNDDYSFVASKVITFAVLTSQATHTIGYLEFTFGLLKVVFKLSWNLDEWRFRLSLDQYIVFVGMMAALVHRRCQELLAGDLPEDSLDLFCASLIAIITDFGAGLTALAALCLVWFGVLASYCTDKLQYNSWHPHVSWIPILCFIILRNSHPILRSCHSALFAWLGRISLETYLLQYHIWLAADTKGVLRLGLFNRGIEAAILTPVFLWCSWLVAGYTRTLTNWIIAGEDTFQLGRLRQPRRPATIAVFRRRPLVLPTTHDRAEAEEDDERDAEVFPPPRGMRWRLFAVGMIPWVTNILIWRRN